MSKTSTKNVLLKLGFVAVLIVLIFQIVLICLFVQNKNMAKNIYNSNCESVLELKCVSNLNSTTFGTAMIINDRGYIITNFHIINIDNNDIRFILPFIFKHAKSFSSSYFIISTSR